MSCLLPYPYKETLLDILYKALNNSIEKEITWQNGLVAKYRVVNTTKILGDGVALQILFKEQHLAAVKKYIQFLKQQNLRL
jgi:hypothetical protein